MKCKICGEELILKGDKYVCEVCGWATSAKPEPDEPTKPERKNVSPSNEDDSDLFSRMAKAKSELAERCAKSVTKVYCLVDDIHACTGTGWRGHENYIITNAHVVDDNHGNPSKGKIWVEYSDYLELGNRQKQEMKIVHFDRNEDIAVLKPAGVIPMEVPVLKINGEMTHIGEPVFTIGNPLHYKFTYIEGTVANPKYIQEDGERKYPVLQTTITLNHGNSGGPVFNTKGEVVGMTTFSELEWHDDEIAALFSKHDDKAYKEVAGYGFCVSGIAIVDALKNIR